VIPVFSVVYLRQPNVVCTARLLSINKASGFPGIIGSINCMHSEWKNCSFAWQVQYSKHVKGCIVILRQLHHKI
jgi:hypothetical protein